MAEEMFSNLIICIFSRNKNPAYTEAFNSLIYDLKKKNSKWTPLHLFLH